MMSRFIDWFVFIDKGIILGHHNKSNEVFWSQQCSVMFQKHCKFSTFLFSPLEPLCIVIEFVSGGSLDKLLRSSRVHNQQVDPTYVNIWSRLTERELLRIASNVASGMSHLESKQVCSWIHEWGAFSCWIYFW